MFRRSALLAVVLVLLISATAGASTVVINITATAYPASTTVALGDAVQWNNQTFNSHTSTGDAPLALWNRSLNGSGSTATVNFRRAGSFPYHCNIHSSMHGRIVVPMKVQPASGTTATTFTITVATAKAPAGYKHVIQRKAPGGAYAAFIATRAKTATFTPSRAGNWSFRAKLKRTSDGASSGWSPVLVVQVN
jgi:plastocyanin